MPLMEQYILIVSTSNSPRQEMAPDSVLIKVVPFARGFTVCFVAAWCHGCFQPVIFIFERMPLHF
jgi:hypothetical protein